MYTYTSYSIHILYNNVNLPPPPPPPTSTARGCDPPNVSRSERGAKKKGQVKRLSARQRGNPQKIRRLVFSSLLSGISEIFPINHPPLPPACRHCIRLCRRFKFMYFVLYRRDHFRCIILLV